MILGCYFAISHGKFRLNDLLFAFTHKSNMSCNSHVGNFSRDNFGIINFCLCGKKKIVLQMTIYKFLKTIFEDSITE